MNLLQKFACIMFLSFFIGYFIGNSHINTILSQESEYHNPSYEEVEAFLRIDKTDENEWTENYKCMNFSIDTILAAEQYGIRAFMVVVMYRNSSEPNHAVVGFLTTDEGLKVFEPQSDAIFKYQFTSPPSVLQQIY